MPGGEGVIDLTDRVPSSPGAVLQAKLAAFPLGLELVTQGFAAWADSVVFSHAVALV